MAAERRTGKGEPHQRVVLFDRINQGVGMSSFLEKATAFQEHIDSKFCREPFKWTFSIDQEWTKVEAVLLIPLKPGKHLAPSAILTETPRSIRKHQSSCHFPHKVCILFGFQPLLAASGLNGMRLSISHWENEAKQPGTLVAKSAQRRPSAGSCPGAPCQSREPARPAWGGPVREHRGEYRLEQLRGGGPASRSLPRQLGRPRDKEEPETDFPFDKKWSLTSVQAKKMKLIIHAQHLSIDLVRLSQDDIYHQHRQYHRNHRYR
ncbi:hypothetical protein ACRRTK_010792 [Alexandromys fortis]